MQPDAGDQQLERLGVRRIPVPIPFPQAGGPVNVLAVEEDGGGFALLDAGLGTPEAEEALRAGLAAAGVAVESIRRILVTHGHIDHYGLAQTLREASSASVAVHPADLAKLSSDGWTSERERYDAFLLAAGVPADKLDRMAELAASTRSFARRVELPIAALAEGQRLSFARCHAEVLEMPGHTPGQCCFLLRPKGGGPIVLVGADHLLERTSPNPLLELLPDGSRFRALPTYLRSIERARSLDVALVAPGHGACFADHRQVIDDLLRFYERRQAKLLGKLPAGGATPVELVRAFFPAARTLDLYLMIGEILGNLDVLEDRGRVVCDTAGGRLRYLPA